jgi:hypothetical protein
VNAELLKSVIANRPQRFTGVSLPLSLRQESVSDIRFVRIFTADAQANIANRRAAGVAQYKYAGSAQRDANSVRSAGSSRISPI